MDSRLFLKQAEQLSTKLHLTEMDDQEEQSKRGEIQRDLNVLFSNLQNPSLSCASRLAEKAMMCGYTIDSRVLHRITEIEGKIKADGYGS